MNRVDELLNNDYVVLGAGYVVEVCCGGVQELFPKRGGAKNGQNGQTERNGTNENYIPTFHISRALTMSAVSSATTERI